MAPRAVMDREQQGRQVRAWSDGWLFIWMIDVYTYMYVCVYLSIIQVYERIIQELRLELDKLTAKYHETNRRCEEEMRRSSRVDQLEEEIKMYKEMARSISLESQK